MSAPAARSRKTAEVLVPSQQGSERRRHRRVQVPAVADVRTGDKHLGLFAVSDLSAGGVSLLGEALLVPGQPLALEVQVPGRPALQLTGKVVRRQVSGPRGRRCAVRFESLAPAAAEALAAVLAEPAPEVVSTPFLVVWNRPVGRAPLERDLTGAEPPLIVQNPLEAAAWLRVSSSKLEVVLVDYLLAGSHGWDLLQHLREQHPRLKRVLLVDGVGNFRLNLLLASGLADAALEKPWTALALARKLRKGGGGGGRR
jgi:CheY-like chemotaxis protein